MRKNKKQRRIMFLLILILCLTLGFALLSTTLYINGTANIKSNTWDIHWDDTSVSVSQGSVSATDPEVSTTTSTKDTVSFDVELELPGDYFEFNVDAVNEGSIDGALELAENFITYKSNNVETTLPDYMDFKVTYDDDTTPATGDVLKASESQTYKIRVEFKSSVEELPENPEPLTIEVNLPYVQHKEETTSPIILPTGKTKDTLEVGDEICIREECFNFIKYDGNDVVMLAKYNLKVGYIYSYDEEGVTGEYTSNTPGYGLQSSEVIGYSYGDSTYNGTVAFSTTNYWDDDNSPKSDYPGLYYPGPNYPTVYDSINYKGAPGEYDEYGSPTNPVYSIAYYVEAYKNILEEYGATIKEARLLTYAEVIDPSTGCTASNHGTYRCSTDGFITNTSFWLGSAYDYSNLWAIRTDDELSEHGYVDHIDYGVRPVIVISKSTL